jgi:hypothetical protein
MWRELRAHEKEHEELAAWWENEVVQRLQWLDPVTAGSERAAQVAAEAAVAEEWSTCLELHNAQQEALDTPPFKVTLVCSAESPEESPEESE